MSTVCQNGLGLVGNGIGIALKSWNIWLVLKSIRSIECYVISIKMGMRLMSNVITVEQLKNSIPSRKGSITEELVNVINEANTEPEFQGVSLFETLVTYENLMVKNKAGIREFVDASRFCAYLVSMEDNYTEAFKKTFSYRDFVKNRMNATSGTKEYNELTNAASRYRRENKLVVDMLTYSQVPIRMFFLGARFEAVNVLIKEMKTAQYSRDRIAAAKEVLLALKEPENVKIELDIGVKENSAVQNLNAQLAEFASNSLKHLEAGTTDLAKLGSMKAKDDVIDAEVE